MTWEMVGGFILWALMIASVLMISASIILLAMVTIYPDGPPRWWPDWL